MGIHSNSVSRGSLCKCLAGLTEFPDAGGVETYIASNNHSRVKRGGIPPAAPRGLNSAGGSGINSQDDSSTARTAFLDERGGRIGNGGSNLGVVNGRAPRPRGFEEGKNEDAGDNTAAAPGGALHGLGVGDLGGRDGAPRMPARMLGPLTGNTHLCVWGEQGSTSVFWDRLIYLCRQSTVIHHVVKIDRVQQEPSRRIRFDLWVTDAYAVTLAAKMAPGAARYGWYFRRHVPYLERVGRGRAPAPVGQAPPPVDPPVDPVAPAPTPVPLLVGTLNVNGVRKKKADIRVLLEDTGCDVLGLQETLQRASDWQLRFPGYHCLSSMGDMTASQRGVALLVSTKFNCAPVGKATPYWTFARLYGATLARPIIVGSVYVPCRLDRRVVLNALPGVLTGLHAEYTTDPIVLVGDFNMTLAPLQIETATWGLPFRVMPIRDDAPTCRRRRQGDAPRAIDYITFYGDAEGVVEPAWVLDNWDTSDHFPVLGEIPGLTCQPDRGVAPPPRLTCAAGSRSIIRRWHRTLPTATIGRHSQMPLTMTRMRMSQSQTRHGWITWQSGLKKPAT